MAKKKKPSRSISIRQPNEFKVVFRIKIEVFKIIQFYIGLYTYEYISSLTIHFFQSQPSEKLFENIIILSNTKYDEIGL